MSLHYFNVGTQITAIKIILRKKNAVGNNNGGTNKKNSHWDRCLPRIEIARIIIYNWFQLKIIIVGVKWLILGIIIHNVLTNSWR